MKEEYKFSRKELGQRVEQFTYKIKDIIGWNALLECLDIEEDSVEFGNEEQLYKAINDYDSFEDRITDYSLEELKGKYKYKVTFVKETYH